MNIPKMEPEGWKKRVEKFQKMNDVSQEEQVILCTVWENII